jgi:hypothetical protein
VAKVCLKSRGGPCLEAKDDQYKHQSALGDDVEDATETSSCMAWFLIHKEFTVIKDVMNALDLIISERCAENVRR